MGITFLLAWAQFTPALSMVKAILITIIGTSTLSSSMYSIYIAFGKRLGLASEDTQNAILSAENVSMKIQGTSSVGYYDACANWDSEFTEGLTDHSSNHLDGMSITADSIPVDYVNNKVNQASCEGANNAILADWYNTYQPYIRP